MHLLEQQNGRHPTEAELADSLGVPLADYQHMLQEARGYQLVYFEDFSGEGEDEIFAAVLARAALFPSARKR